MAIDQNKFPEHVMHMFVINAPRICPTLWGMAKPLICERTQRKIHIWGASYLPSLQQYIALDQIPADFGGRGGRLEVLSGDAPGPQPVPGPTSAPPVRWKCPSPPPVVRATARSPVKSPKAGGEGVARRDSGGSFATARSSAMGRVPSEASFLTAREPEEGEEGDCLTPLQSSDGAFDAAVLRPWLEDHCLGTPAAPWLGDWPGRVAFAPSADLCRNPPLGLALAADAVGSAVVQCRLRRVLLAETRHNLVLRPGPAPGLVAELRQVGPRGLVLHDRDGAARFAFRRRRLRREVRLFLCGQGRATAAGGAPAGRAGTAGQYNPLEQLRPGAVGRPLAKLQRQQMYVMSALPTRKGGAGDWVVKAPGQGPWAMHRKGPEVFWGGSLRELEPDLIFAMAVGIMHLWGGRAGAEGVGPCTLEQCVGFASAAGHVALHSAQAVEPRGGLGALGAE